MKNAILLHLHYQDLWSEFWSYLKYIKDENTHLYVTVHTENTPWYSDIKANATEVFLIENKGMDFGGFLYAYNKIKHKDYKIIIKTHGKKRNGFANRRLKFSLNVLEWSKKLLDFLFKPENYETLKKTFENEKVFIVGSEIFLQTEDKSHPWTIGIEAHNIKGNQESYDKINKILNLLSLDKYEFVAGSMFAASKAYLDLFFNNKEMDLFNIMEEPPFPNNGTIAHSLERLISSHTVTFGGTFFCN